MTEEKKNDPPENTGESPKPNGELPKEKKPRKPKTEKQIEAAKKNLLKIRNKGKQSTHSEESKVIIRDESPDTKKKPAKPKEEEKKGWNGRFRFHF